MKKISIAIVLLAMSFVGFSAANPDVNEKVLTSFKKVFKNPKQTTWHENDNGYEVRFFQDDIDSRVWFDMEGNIVRTHRYYDQYSLPSFILAKLKKKFEGKSIFGVTEVYDQTRLEYYIKLQDDKNWITVKADASGNMDVTEKYKKA